MSRDLHAAQRHCASSLVALDQGALEDARRALALARRALDHWGSPYPQTDAQMTRLLDRPLVTDPVVIAAEWLQLADDKLRGDTLAGDEPYEVQEYLNQESPDDPPASPAVNAWCGEHRVAVPRTAAVYIATALATLEGR